MIIRTACLSDAHAVAEIYKFDLGYETDINLIKKRLNNLDNNRETVFVAELDGEVVGVIHAETFETLYYKPIANVLSLAVRENRRQQGIGKALMSEVEKWSKSKGLDEIRIESACHRKAAHGFYRKIGFDSEKNQIRFLKKIT